MRDQNGTPIRPKPRWMIERSAFMACMGWHEDGMPPPPDSPGELVTVPGYAITKPDGDTVETDEMTIHTGAAHHFMALADCFFSDPSGVFFYEWNPWAQQLLEDKILHRRYAVAGSASSGKSESLVVWGILNWLCRPFDTKVLISSTTKSSATGKVWGSMCEAFQQVARVMGDLGMPGKLLKSQYKIIYELNGVTTTKAGIELVSGAESEAAESAEKVQGYKRERVFVLVDEFATLSKGLDSTIRSNLFANPMLDFFAAFNPKSFHDTAGQFSRPKDPRGWESVDVETECWQSEEGFIRHLDGEKSPNANYVTGKARWRGILTADKIEQRAQAAGGRNTSEYMTMCRGWFPSAGALDTIYTEMEIIKNRGDHTIANWDSPTTKVAGFDPAFTHGGDLSIVAFGELGTVTDSLTKQRKKVFQLNELVRLAEDVRSGEPKVDQMISQLIEECKKRKVDPRHMAMDETGGGIALASLIATKWSNDFLRVQFGGRATTMPISMDNPKLACDEYANRATELWFSGKPLLRSGQLKIGNQPDLFSEMCSRLHLMRGSKIACEPKEEMKERLRGSGASKSPDRSDAFFLCIDLCRQRLGLASREKPGKIDRRVAALPGIYQYLQGTKTPQKLYDYGASLKK